MSLFPSEKKVEYFSRFGRALKANHFSPERSSKPPPPSPPKASVRMLTQEEIEAKIQTVSQRLALNCTPVSFFDHKESPSFRSITREQRNKIDKFTTLETPSPTHYYPQFGFVQKRSASTKLVTNRTMAKTRQVALPGCVDECTLNCTRSEKHPHLDVSTLRSPKEFQEDTYLSLLQIREERRSSPGPPIKHIPSFEFNKQLKRAGIPLNPSNESHFEVPPRADHVSGPSFDKNLPRPEVFESPPILGGVYDYDKSKFMNRIDTGAVTFTKMSPRPAFPQRDAGAVESPDLMKLDAALSVVKPRTHIPSPNIGKSPPRDDSWIRHSRQSPRRTFLTTKPFTMEIKRKSLGNTRK